MPNPDTQKPDLASARALDPHYYQDDDWFTFEQRHILSGWQKVAPVESVSEPGDVIARDIAGMPIIIVRAKDGALKGFYNICPHRAGPLAMCDQKGLKRLRCFYHGWAYDFEGKLSAAPEMQEAEGFDPNTIRLTPIVVKEWHGLVFARLPGLAEKQATFEDLTAGIDEIIGDGLDGIVHHHGTTYDVAANWKVYVDNFLEGYHLPFVHPGLTQVVEYADYITQLGEWWSLQRSPVPADTGAYGAGEGLYFFIYPNTMLNIMPGRLQTNRVIPNGRDACRVEFDFYYAPGAEARFDEDLAFSSQVQEEDRLICEHVQKGLTSQVYRPGRLSPTREAGVWHWQNLLRDAYGFRRDGVPRDKILENK